MSSRDPPPRSKKRTSGRRVARAAPTYEKSASSLPERILNLSPRSDSASLWNVSPFAASLTGEVATARTRSTPERLFTSFRSASSLRVLPIAS